MTPVKQVRRIQEFTWTMAKLQITIDNTIEGDEERITYYKRFKESLTMKTVEGRAEETCYQGVKLANYHLFRNVEQIKSLYLNLIFKITVTMSNRFEHLTESPVFKHLVALLDVSTWAKDTTPYTEEAISEMIEHFKPLLVKTNVSLKTYCWS